MKGLLDAVGGAPQAGTGMPPTAGPVSEPTSGQDQASEGAGVTPEMQAQAQELSKKAISILYEDEKEFEKMVNVFKAAKTDQQIAQQMSIVANGTMNKLEQETGPLDGEMVQSVGVVLLITLFQDLAQGQIIPEISEEGYALAAGKSLQDWMQANPDRADPEDLQRAAAQGQQGEQPQPEQPGILAQPQAGVA